jgi:hypothetical protein
VELAVVLFTTRAATQLKPVVGVRKPTVLDEEPNLEEQKANVVLNGRVETTFPKEVVLTAESEVLHTPTFKLLLARAARGRATKEQRAALRTLVRPTGQFLAPRQAAAVRDALLVAAKKVQTVGRKKATPRVVSSAAVTAAPVVAVVVEETAKTETKKSRAELRFLAKLYAKVFAPRVSLRSITHRAAAVKKAFAKASGATYAEACRALALYTRKFAIAGRAETRGLPAARRRAIATATRKSYNLAAEVVSEYTSQHAEVVELLARQMPTQKSLKDATAREFVLSQTAQRTNVECLNELA